MVASADLSPITAAPPVTAVSGLAVASAATAPRPVSDVAVIAAQVTADLAALTENLAAPTQPSALAAMIGEAATQQESLAPLLADLAVAMDAPAMPPAARVIAEQILAAQTPLGADVTAGQLQSAAQHSGVFLEAALAGAALDPAAAPNLQQDLKALLLQLASELAPLIQGPSPPRQPPTQLGTRTLPARAAAESPEPPVGGGPTAGQPPSRPSLSADAAAETLARTLQHEAQGALARVQLSQAASVERSGAPTRWMFEVPIATPTGTGVAQFEISRDGRGPGGAAADPGWRARFSVDVDPSGPIHADVLLARGRARVTLMAEDEAARLALADGQGELAEALAAEQGADVAVRVIGGAPPRPRQPAGLLVDRRS